MKKKLILITGRTSKQAIGMHRGKSGSGYKSAVAQAGMNRLDMEETGLGQGDIARFRSQINSVEVPVFEQDIPLGMVFMPMGPEANRLIPADTMGTGMPAFKNQTVEVDLP